MSSTRNAPTRSNTNASNDSLEGVQGSLSTGALLRTPLFRCNSLDRDRERRRRKRQWQRRRRTLDSNGDAQSGTETSPEDMLETEEPSTMVSFLSRTSSL